MSSDKSAGKKGPNGSGGGKNNNNNQNSTPGNFFLTLNSSFGFRDELNFNNSLNYSVLIRKKIISE